MNNPSNWYTQSGTKYISNISQTSQVQKFQHKCIICQKAIVVSFEQVKVILKRIHIKEKYIYLASPIQYICSVQTAQAAYPQSFPDTVV
jgi:hypothetical protein